MKNQKKRRVKSHGSGRRGKRPEYVIVTPRQDSGGSVVLHTLCRELSNLGYKAEVYYAPRYDYIGHELRYWLDLPVFMVYDTLCMLAARFIRIPAIQDSPKFGMYFYVPVKGCRRRLLPLVGRNVIVVYPEVVSGNPLHARHVVRWFLYFHPYGDRQDVFSKKDLFFCYQDSYNDARWNPDCRTFKIGYYNLNLYKQTNFGERKGNCYVVRKGKNRPDLPEKLDGIVVDDLSEQDKVKVFNECKYCYSYDMNTAYLQIAALCGCIAVAVPEPSRSKEDYGSEYIDRYGVAFGTDEKEIEFAVSTRQKALEKYQRMNQESRELVRRFAKECESFFFAESGSRRQKVKLSERTRRENR